jgi:hypothetical protein
MERMDAIATGTEGEELFRVVTDGCGNIWVVDGGSGREVHAAALSDRAGESEAVLREEIVEAVRRGLKAMEGQ